MGEKREERREESERDKENDAGRGEERALGKTPLVDRALDDCLAFRSSEGAGGRVRRFRNHLVRAAIDRRCQFSNSFRLLSSCSPHPRRRRRCHRRRRRRVVPPLLRARRHPPLSVHPPRERPGRSFLRDEIRARQVARRGLAAFEGPTATGGE